MTPDDRKQIEREVMEKNALALASMTTIQKKSAEARFRRLDRQIAFILGPEIMRKTPPRG